MDWSELIPIIIVFVFWALGKAFGNEQETPSPTRKPLDKDATERLEAEIRRKIAERRASQADQRRYDPTKSYQEQRYPAQTYKTPAVPAAPKPKVAYEEPSMPVASLEQLQKQIAHFRQQAAEASASLASKRATTATISTRKSPTSTPAQNRDLRALLHDTHGARKAFVLQEILGTPIGLRRGNTAGPPGLSY